jgi:hypothetical protein
MDFLKIQIFCDVSFRRPERMMTQNGRVTSILICLHQSKTTNRRNREERFKIDIIINSHISHIKINIVIDFSYLNDMDLYLNQTLRILRVKKTWNTHIL